MRRLRIGSAFVIFTLAAFSLMGLAVLTRIVSDGLNRYPTIAKLQNARDSWDKGQGMAAAKDLAAASWMTVDGGARWQVAQYYLARAVSYKHNKQMMEAAKTCDQANTVLGKYDNGWEMDYYCDWMVWDLDAP